MEVEKLVSWCRGEQLELKHALMLSGVCSDTPDRVIYEILDKVEGLGRTKIRGRCVGSIQKTQLVLVESSKDLKLVQVPEQVGLDEVGPWKVTIMITQPLSESVEVTDFQAKLLTFLANEGKTLAEAKGVFETASVTPKALDWNTELVNAISSLVDKCTAAPAEVQGYRKLRMFSGGKPTPNGEEEYDAWAEQTTHMLEEWQCSDMVKRQRIVESLKGPAADIVRFLRVSNPNVTANDYLNALENAFGTTESASALMVRFRNTFQLEGEKLSAYLLRLDKLLHTLFRKGGIDLADMNRVRIEQVARGALSHDLVGLRIRMTSNLRPPPSFTDLLREVREEEDMISERIAATHMASSAAVTSAKTATVAAMLPCTSKSVPAPVSSVSAEKDSGLESLRKEMEELKCEVTRLISATVATRVGTEQQKLTGLKATGGNDDTRFRERPQRTLNRADIFCYRCGEDGHFQRECQNPENLRKVNQRLLKRRQGNFPGTQ